MKISDKASLILRCIAQFLNEDTPSRASVSPHTRRGYRDAIGLYLDYLDARGVTPENLTPECFSSSTIEDWLEWLLTERGNSAQTCNVRLAALRSFLKFFGRKHPDYLYLSVEAQSIPRLKQPKVTVQGMSKEAVAVLLRTPDSSTAIGRRDVTLMTVLYSTAARIGELLSLKVKDLHIEHSKPNITVLGKGNKNRTLYLVSGVAAHIRAYLREFHGSDPDPEAYVFYSRNTGIYGKMTEAAVDKMLKKHARAAHTSCPDVPENLHAHQFRHAKATHWLADGMNIVQISFLLGHEQLQTTMKYLDITTEQEFAALSTLAAEENHGSQNPKWTGQGKSLRELCGI